MAKIKKCAGILNNGGIIIYPTSTLYGIGGNPFISEVIDRIASIKQDDKKSYILLVRDKLMLSSFVEQIDPIVAKIIENFWPGSITLILKTKSHLPVSAIDGTSAFRMDDHIVVKELFKYIDFPLISTSANLHGMEAPTKFNQIPQEILKKVDGFLVDDKGVKGIPSTIIRFEGDMPVIVREGAIKMVQIVQAVQTVQKSCQ